MKMLNKVKIGPKVFGIVRKKLIMALTAIIVMTSCKKEKVTITTPPTDVLPEVLAPLQNPLIGYLSATGFNQTVINYENSSAYEFGISFEPKVKGTLTSLIVKIPNDKNALRVTIWDKATATVLRTETISNVISDITATKNINPLQLEKDKEYIITMNSTAWNRYQKTNNTDATYPVVVGDLAITGYCYGSGTAQVMPTITNKAFYSGDLSFTFQK